MAGLTLDAWSLVFEQATREDLCSLCLVSRSFNTLATPLLYRSITLVQGDADIDDFSTQGRHWLLLSRLEDDANGNLRNLVQEVALCRPPGIRINTSFLRRLTTDNCLSKLITSLPNLRRVTITISRLQTAHLIRTISTHPRTPELILRLDTGECAFADQHLPCVSSLTVAVDPFDERNGPNERMLTVQRLFLNCPALRSFSLTLFENYGGCVRHIPQHPVIRTFRLTGTERFPPLQELGLNGYRVRDELEWIPFRDCVQWSRLSGLTLGPLPTGDNLLSRITGYATSLEALRVYAYADEDQENSEGLERLLLSFDSLRTLEVRGYVCSVEAIGNHAGLSTLCLHEDEPGERSERQRRVFTAQELDYLDSRCPKLRSLAIDIQRGDNKLPDDVLEKLSTGFANLSHLSLHFELGLSTLKNPITPVLNYTTAQTIGQSIFTHRRESGIPISSAQSFKLTLWTGSSFRRFPQWEPRFCAFERLHTATYEVRLLCLHATPAPARTSKSSDRQVEVEVRHLQRERLELIEAGKAKPDTILEKKDLGVQVRAAVEGPEKRGGRWSPDYV
ncbi:uncharacterized protein BJX67DRAFT_356005 [Aspergillus lucknowensis]|uniref:F-box domain-containing protein n=1 Tax=Aspergillus lucknowensis TaxID=176173 RepID=A0ABR4LNW4_9EURO